MYAQTDCSSCEHKSWESKWTSKLGRARTFLAKLTEKRMPGADEVSALVTELNDKFYEASWNARDTSHTFKKSVARVSVSDRTIGRSPLIQEVRPEDVVDLEEKDWAEMGEHDYDGDYVASTDPIHPVSTDYSHPLDDDDGRWIFNHFSTEELETSSGEDLAPDFDQTGWSCDNDNSKISIPIAESQEENTKSKMKGNDLIAWKPEAEASSMFTNISMNGLRKDNLSITEKLESEEIELIIEAFWAFVNNSTTNNNQQPQQFTEGVSVLLRNLDIAPAASKSPSPLFAPTNLLAKWVDSPSDTSPLTSIPTSPPSPPVRPPTPPSPNSTRTAYNKHRKFLKKQLQDDADQTKYYGDLLLVSRWEARALEGPEGRFVPDPQMVRVLGGSNGWFQ